MTACPKVIGLTGTNVGNEAKPETNKEGDRYPLHCCSLRIARSRGGPPASTWAAKIVDYSLVGSPCSAQAMVPPFRLRTLR
jgi:hypothetical protein